MNPRLPRVLLLSAAALAAGCAAHRAQVREFERGRETPFWREQAARAAAETPVTGPEDTTADRAPSLGALRDRWVRRVEEKDDYEGILDLADPAVRAAREAWRATVEQLDQSQWLEEVAASLRSFAADVDTRIGGGTAGTRSMTAGSWPWPAGAALRGEMADLEAAMAREKARGALVAALADAEDAFAAAWEAGERVRVLEGFLPALRNMAEVASTRYATGRGRQDESLRIESEIRWMETDLAAAAARRTEASARLNALLDRAPDAPLGALAAPVPPGAPPSREALLAAVPGAPEVGMAARSLDLALVAVRMAEVMNHPLPASEAPVSARPGFGPLEGAGGGMASDAAPPWYGVEEAYIRELRRRAAAAAASRDAALRAGEATAAGAWRMMDTALRDLRTARDTAVPLAEQAFEVSGRDFATGAATFADHLEAWGALVRARLREIESRRMALEARAEAFRATARRIGE